MTETRYLVQQRLSDGSWARLSVEHVDESEARKELAKWRWQHPVLKFNIVKETVNREILDEVFL